MILTTCSFVVLVIGTWLHVCSRPLAATISRQYKLPFCADEKLMLTADKKYDVYIDGVKVHNLPNASVWQNPDRVKLRATARVIAVKGIKSENTVGGFLASSSYLVTDASWKCTNKYYNGWTGVNFDDSAWPQATVIGTHGVSPWGIIPGISTDAKWIWTSKYSYGQDADNVVYCRKTREYCDCIGTGQSCVTLCKFLVDGNYQSCKGCHVFATCSYGVLYDEKPCEGDVLYWDDKLKRCENQSSTCKFCSIHETTMTTMTSAISMRRTIRPTTLTTQLTETTTKPPNTIKPTSLTTMITTPTHTTPQSSLTTYPLHTHTHAGRKTTTLTTLTLHPEHSATTPSTRITTICTTGPTCITFCRGLADGEYQSCKGCHVYAACSYEKLTDEIPCNSDEPLVWDDNLKRCTYHSTTCQSCPHREATPTSTVTDERKHMTTTSEVCLTERSRVTSCCRTGDENSCISKLFYFMCLIISHV